jgi:hypothetical protein
MVKDGKGPAEADDSPHKKRKGQRGGPVSALQLPMYSFLRFTTQRVPNLHKAEDLHGGFAISCQDWSIQVSAAIARAYV